MRAKATAVPLLVLILAASSAAAAPRARAPALAPASSVFAISGRGWGHGVGMSQYGALGFARRGWTYARILAHYYRGTTLGRAAQSRVRVLLSEGTRSVRISSAAPFTVRDAAGMTHELAPGNQVLGARLRVTLADGSRAPLSGPLLFTPGSAALSLAGKPYRGSLEVAVVQGRLRAINVVGLDAYLLGVVPREVPSRWPAEALKAQAVVARSYALAVRKRGRPFDLYADVRSQVYGGMAAEQQATSAAVRATSGEIVLYGGRVATTYFFSTSGGRTADIADVWNSAPVPYLVSVPDPYDSISPHHTWGPLPLAPERLARTLRARAPLVDVRTVVNRSARVDSVVGVTPTGEVRSTGASMRTALGLRSTWFRVGVLSLERPRAPVVFGSRVELRGVARGLRGTTLERREQGRGWIASGTVTPAAGGTFTHAVTPVAPTEYRLASGSVRTAPVRVVVAPVVRLATPRDATTIDGSVRPTLARATVVLERREGQRWVRVATATIDERGRFTARLRLVPGTYRARIGAFRGYAAAMSRPLVVAGPGCARSFLPSRSCSRWRRPPTRHDSPSACRRSRGARSSRR